MDDSKPDTSQAASSSPHKSFASDETGKRKSILEPKSGEEDIFITENKDDFNPQAAEIQGLYDQINGKINNLDQRVGHILKRHEYDFLTAYKEHMYNVQKEMRQLRDKADEEECKKRRDSKISQLEHERDWFRNEAVRLDKICKEYKRGVEKWKSRVETLEDDQGFLETQIMNTKMENLHLKEQVEESGMQSKQNAIEAASVTSSQFSEQERQAMLRSSSKSSGMLRPQTASANKLPIKASISMTQEFAQREKDYQDQIAQLKAQLQSEKRNMNQLKTATTNFVMEKGELEEFFLACIEEVRKDILKRRMRSFSYQSKSNRILPRVGSERFFKSKEADVRLSNFTDTDKRKVIEMMISNERVLMFLYEQLFPQKQPNVNQSENLTRPQLRGFQSANSSTNLRSSGKSLGTSNHGLSNHQFSSQAGLGSAPMLRPRTVPAKKSKGNNRL